MNLSGEVRSDEANLVERARTGDETAWETLMRRHQEAAFRLAYLILGDAHEAEDAAQEAFVRAYRSLRRFDVSRPFRPWLLSIAANQARNRQRAFGRYRAALFRLGQSQEERGPDSDSELHRRWEAQALWQAVRRLKAESQDVVYLRHFLMLSEYEAAEALGVPQGTVKSRLHRALEALKSVIEQEFPALKEGRK